MKPILTALLFFIAPSFVVAASTIVRVHDVSVKSGFILGICQKGIAPISVELFQGTLTSNDDAYWTLLVSFKNKSHRAQCSKKALAGKFKKNDQRLKKSKAKLLHDPHHTRNRPLYYMTFEKDDEIWDTVDARFPKEILDILRSSIK